MLLVAPTRALQIAWRPMCQNSLGFAWLGLTRFLCKVAISTTNQVIGQSPILVEVIRCDSHRREILIFFCSLRGIKFAPTSW
jgi:hypothetical protein